MRPSLLAFTALSALALGALTPAFAQPQEHREGREPAAAPAARPAPPPAPRAAPPPPPRFSPGPGPGPGAGFRAEPGPGFRPSPGPQGAPFAPRAQFQRPPAFEGGRADFARPESARVQVPQGDPRARFDRGYYARPGETSRFARPDERPAETARFGRPDARPDRYAGTPGFSPGQVPLGGRAPGYQGGAYQGGAYQRGVREPGAPLTAGEAARPGYGARQGFYGSGQSGVRPAYDPRAIVGPDGQRRFPSRPGVDRDPRPSGLAQNWNGAPRANGQHFDPRREYGHERREWEHEGGFHGGDHDFDRYRHDYEYRDWHRDNDENRLTIINRYGYNPWGYGFRPGWNDYGRSYWGNNLGWGFDLRFGYWYGPSYYDPGYNWWYGPEAPYQYGVRAEELILRDSTLHNWALQNFDYNRDGYLDRDEVRAAARALRQIADYNGDGWIQSSEYQSALDRLGASHAYQSESGYDSGQGYEPGYDGGPQQPDERPY